MNFQKWLNLREMSLNRYITHFGVEPAPFDYGGNKPTVGYFNDVDQIIITHPKTVRKLEEILNRTKWKFNILLYESGSGRQGKAGAETRSANREMYNIAVQKFAQKENIPLEGHITFVKDGSSGGPLTPWMIVHTIGHALLNPNSGYDTDGGKRITKILQDIWEKYSHNFHADDQEAVRTSGDFGTGIDGRPFLDFMGRIFGFQSARLRAAQATATPSKKKDEGFPNTEELVHDLVAHFLYSGGKITIQPNEFGRVEQKYNTYQYSAYWGKHSDAHPRISNVIKQPIQIDQAFLDEKAKEIGQQISYSLDSAVGQIIYDYFE